jgi:hypothetical protein
MSKEIEMGSDLLRACHTTLRSLAALTAMAGWGLPAQYGVAEQGHIFIDFSVDRGRAP